MEKNIQDSEKAQEFVFHLIKEENKTEEEVVSTMLTYGYPEDYSRQIYTFVKNKIKQIENIPARKNMLYGALWCLGGTILTIADIGYIFWGAIVFGGIQFLKGVGELK
jgi:hypothetical protein